MTLLSSRKSSDMVTSHDGFSLKNKQFKASRKGFSKLQEACLVRYGCLLPISDLDPTEPQEPQLCVVHISYSVLLPHAPLHWLAFWACTREDLRLAGSAFRITSTSTEGPTSLKPQCWQQTLGIPLLVFAWKELRITEIQRRAGQVRSSVVVGMKQVFPPPPLRILFPFLSLSTPPLSNFPPQNPLFLGPQNYSF